MCRNFKDMYSERNLQQIDAVSGPCVYQTPDPSLLFPSSIAAFLTGSSAKESGHRSQLRGIEHIYQSMDGPGPHERSVVLDDHNAVVCPGSQLLRSRCTAGSQM